MLIEQCRPRAAIVGTPGTAARPARSTQPSSPSRSPTSCRCTGSIACWRLTPPAGLAGRPVAVTEQDPACVICTSGSTGQPKAVIVPHGAISALVPDANYLTFTPDDRVAY